jgi:hypothetical protein
MFHMLQLYLLEFTFFPYIQVGHTVAQLEHYATNWQVVGSIPDGVIGIFH